VGSHKFHSLSTFKTRNSSRVMNFIQVPSYKILSNTILRVFCLGCTGLWGTQGFQGARSLRVGGAEIGAYRAKSRAKW
jgi:hypothetical protein